MKKRIIIILLTLSIVPSLLFGCNKAPLDTNKSSTATQKVAQDISIVGQYVREIPVILGNESITLVHSITLSDDHTCIIAIEDDIEGTWSDSEITLNNGEKHSFIVNDDELLLDPNGVDALLSDKGNWISYKLQK